ncbi:MAG: DNA mismatch repair protein MutS [Acidobacteriia bacterium]|nr:DNA mismatch repair protein MutS [Terriglobia bacterium]MBV8903671.1 DNA mismatch repair protein MutS [Terriglobia bacterium]
MDSQDKDPRSIYSQRLEERRADLALRERRHRALGWLQLAAVGCALICVWLALANHAFSILWALVPAALFVAFLLVHDRLLKRSELRRRSVRYFDRALARLDGNWADTGETGLQYLDPAHPYAADLDIFGKASLFELLCTARTHIGEETLANWLKYPADPDTVRARQQAVRELQPMIDLREHLAVLAEEARSGVDPVSLAAWGEQAAILPPLGRILAWPLTMLGAAGLAALVSLILDGIHLIVLPELAVFFLRDVFLFTLLANGLYLYSVRRRTEEVVSAVEAAAHGLALLAQVLVSLEREQFRSPLLTTLRQSLATAGEPASHRISRLRRIVEYVDSREHFLVRALEIFLLWTAHCAYAAEGWRRQSGGAVRRWLLGVGEIEALCSLASHAFEHPSDSFPEITPENSKASAYLEAEAIGHPLLNENRMVRNDVRLGGNLRLLVVSGSNMSGKSTLLRTLGVNAVLAQAGGPVRARRLALSPLAIGASIRVSDSLEAGVSRFYAEILRIRQIVDLTGGSMPVLFLIDEFLHGTNSHDRRVGAEALVASLVKRGAMGLITTHDLALADIAETLGDSAANVHFEDQLVDGKIHFDYVMRPGVVRKSNAIELMRSVGLEI